MQLCFDLNKSEGVCWDDVNFRNWTVYSIVVSWETGHYLSPERGGGGGGVLRDLNISQ